MLFRRVLRDLLTASSAVLLVAGAHAIAARRRRAARSVEEAGSEKPACRNPGVATAQTSRPSEVHATRNDFFEITRSRSKDAKRKWVLQGFGRYQCFLLFDTWQDAMDQATFRIESLSVGTFIPLSQLS